MSKLPRYYDATFKQRVVEYYIQNQPNVSFRFVADLFQIKGGHKTVKRWFDRYDGTVLSLQQQHRSGRPSILNKEQAKQLITKVIRTHNHEARAIDYVKIANSIRQQTNIPISLRTVQRYGQQSGIRSKRTIKRTYRELNDSSCDAIAKLRRALQRISNKKIIFVDETYIKINEVPRTTLVAPGEKPYVVVTDSSSYAARYDVIAAIVGNRVLAPMIFTPQNRKERKVKGINGDMFIDYIENVLCPSILELDPSPVCLVFDKSNIHNISKVEQTFCNVGYTELAHIFFIPTQAAKRVSPLDDTLFHEWKERIRQNSLLTEEILLTTMVNEWYNIKDEHIKHHYDHCAITYGQDVYKDCPFPFKHSHFP